MRVRIDGGYIALAVFATGAFLSNCANREINSSRNIQPSATPSTSMSEPLKSGLARMNYYRELSGLPTVSGDPELSEGARLHSIYIVKNNLVGGTMSLRDG